MGFRRGFLGARNAISLSVADDGLLVEGVSVRAIEGRSRRNQRIGHRLVGDCAGAEFDAG